MIWANRRDLKEILMHAKLFKFKSNYYSNIIKKSKLTLGKNFCSIKAIIINEEKMPKQTPPE